ncbi:hypothetical protein [Pseudoalteromonas luteoviolacea]|uniref:hypothetical protein n=1 Tax=Pseudoalteromonas luteoviolacea TaxID=43657 RepID=UPI001B3586FF|nr:hypothetical protein [Pseudoalteromonas luteoviolacea]MBQ4838497.1 hypothetical protein [Pseudoalteromonas luteoviolacea]
MIQLRNIKLREEFKQGASIQDLVRRYKLTRQLINLIVTSEANGAPIVVGDAHKQMELKLQVCAQPSLLGAGAVFFDSYLNEFSSDSRRSARNRTMVTLLARSVQVSRRTKLSNLLYIFLNKSL